MWDEKSSCSAEPKTALRAEMASVASSLLAVNRQGIAACSYFLTGFSLTIELSQEYS